MKLGGRGLVVRAVCNRGDVGILTPEEGQRALRVLWRLYAILREVHDDEIPRGLAERGTKLRAALDAGDGRAAHECATEVGEWLRRNRHVITTRIELSFPALSGHPASG